MRPRIARCQENVIMLVTSNGKAIERRALNGCLAVARVIFSIRDFGFVDRTVRQFFDHGPEAESGG